MSTSGKPFRGVYMMNAIYGLAGSFIGIFIPIYLLEKNLNPANVFSFYLIYTLVILIFFFITNQIVRAIGLRKTVLIGYPFLFLYFFLLYTLNQYGTPIYILAIVSGIQASLYWFPLHMWLTNTSREGNIGNDLGKFFAASQVIGLFAPIIGACIVLFFGFKALFIFTTILYLISAIPVLYLPEFPFEEKIHIKRFFQLLREYPHYIVAEIFENIREDAEGIIWPVFIYLTFRNILSIGYIGTISGVGAILFNLLVGKYTDKIDKRKLLSAGALIMVVIWTFRFFATTPTIAYSLTLVAAFFGILIMIPINTMVYGLAKREGAPTFILFREFGVTLGRVVLYIFAFLAIQSINYIFIFTALACLGLFYLSRKNLEIKAAT
jgi:MFS family permease